MNYDNCMGMCPCCPHTNVNPLLDPHESTNKVLKRLCEHMCCEEGALLINRQLTLLNHFLGLTGDQIEMKNVKYVTVILEFMCQHLEETPQYKEALWCTLRHCLKPPVVVAAGELINAEYDLAYYFTGLGNCLIVVTDNDIKMLLTEVMHMLLGTKGERYFSHEIRVKGLMNSKIGEQLEVLINGVDDEFYPNILDLLLKYTNASKDCALTLLKGDIIFQLLTRLKLQSCSHNDILDHIGEVTSSIIWRLLSYMENKKSEQPLVYQEEVMRLLRLWLRREVIKERPQVRNDVTALTCRILHIYPNDGVIKSGIFEDVCLLAFAPEFEVKYSWAKGVKFLPTTYNLNFKKLLILIICSMFKCPGVRMVADCYSVFPGLTYMICPEFLMSNIISWNPESRCQLISYALQALPVVAEFLPEKYIASGATSKIFQLIKCASASKTMELLKCSLNCINSLITKGIRIEHFSKCDALPVALDVACNLLKDPLTFENQEILCHCFMLISASCQCSALRSTSYNLIVSIGKQIVKRVYEPLKQDSKLHESFKIMAANYIWQTIANFPATRKLFVDGGGIYSLLDLAKRSSLTEQTVLIGIIADLSEHNICIPQLVTWKGDRDRDTVLALLCSIWRRQETVKGVRRDKKGCILDSETILEGKTQANLKPSWSYCPAVTEMIGCVRPKIYAIVYNILHLHFKLMQAAKKTYGVDPMNITYEDEITLKIINHYDCFKKGEVFNNLWNGFLKMKIVLVPHIENTLFLLSKMYFYTAGNLSYLQQDICKKEFEKDYAKEISLYDNLRTCMLSEALDSFMKIRNELYGNSRAEMTLAKKQMESDFENVRTRQDINIDLPEYHAIPMVGISMPKAQRTQFSYIRKNSSLLRPCEYLDTKIIARSRSTISRLEAK